MIDVSVLIVTWNSSDVIKQCIDSVIKNSNGLEIELVIIDNNSDDDTFSIINYTNFRNLQTFQNSENLGFTKAINQAISFSRGKYLFLLNPDTVLKEGCINQLIKFLDINNSYGACAPLMLNEDGTIQHSVRNFPAYLSMFYEFTMLAFIFQSSKFFGKWKMKYYKYDKDDDINQPMAAAFMFRKGTVGNMDERFIMFFSDVDICKRIIEKGEKIRLVTSANVIHKHGESIKKDRARMIKIWNRDCLEYFNKFHPNTILLLWLRINLKLSEFIRIFIYKIFK